MSKESCDPLPMKSFFTIIYNIENMETGSVFMLQTFPSTKVTGRPIPSQCAKE